MNHLNKMMQLCLVYMILAYVLILGLEEFIGICVGIGVYSEVGGDVESGDN